MSEPKPLIGAFKTKRLRKKVKRVFRDSFENGYTKEEDIVNTAVYLIKEKMRELKHRIKSACEFFLRYKDNPQLFTEEILSEDIKFRKAEKEEEWDEGGTAYMCYEEGEMYFVFYNCVEEKDDKIIRELVKEFGAEVLNDYVALSRPFTIEEFNEWLFKLAFKDIFESEVSDNGREPSHLRA